MMALILRIFAAMLLAVTPMVGPITAVLAAETPALSDGNLGEEPDGMMSASSLRPIPQGSSFAVQAWDNSAENIELGRFIEEQLRSRGYTVSSNASVVLKFSSSDALGQLSSSPRRQLVELDGQAGTATEDEARVRLNLFSSDKGGVFNEGRPQTKVLSTQTLEMTLDRKDGQRLWQGEATAKLTHQDRRQISRQLVAPLLDSLGKTVRGQQFGVK